MSASCSSLTPELRHSLGTAQIQAADQELNDPIGHTLKDPKSR